MRHLFLQPGQRRFPGDGAERDGEAVAGLDLQLVQRYLAHRPVHHHRARDVAQARGEDLGGRVGAQEALRDRLLDQILPERHPRSAKAGSQFQIGAAVDVEEHMAVEFRLAGEGLVDHPHRVEQPVQRILGFQLVHLGLVGAQVALEHLQHQRVLGAEQVEHRRGADPRAAADLLHRQRIGAVVADDVAHGRDDPAAAAGLGLLAIGDFRRRRLARGRRNLARRLSRGPGSHHGLLHERQGSGAAGMRRMCLALAGIVNDRGGFPPRSVLVRASISRAAPAGVLELNPAARNIPPAW